jgi:hypothetical protein
MNSLLLLGIGFGALAGLSHAYGLLRARRRRAVLPGAAGEGGLYSSAPYVALWTVALWMLFGTYVLALWGLAALVYAGKRVWQFVRPSTH